MKRGIFLAFLLAAALPTRGFQGEDAYPVFRDVTRDSGIGFQHVNSPTAAKYVVETMGSGCGFVDVDGDGYLDIFLVNGGPLPGSDSTGSTNHALYRNQQNGSFREITREAGISGNRLFGQGVAVGDYDNDGDQDLFLTHFQGPNILYRNKGDGTLADVTAAAGVAGDGRWSVSAAFLDYDRDGDLDLYVVRYINNTQEHNLRCGSVVEKWLQTYCTPKMYEGLPDLLYRNNDDGTFTDVSAATGIGDFTGKGLGVVAADYNLDGWTDIYVANDTGENFLFENNRDGTFSQVGLARGVAVDENGNPQAGMGVALGDFDNDGLPDLAVSNLDFEYLALYRQLPQGHFEDASSRAGTLAPSAPFVGFGMGFLDFDNDSDLDLFVANGHIFDNAPLVREGASYRQRKLLFENREGYFVEAVARHGEALLEPQVSRGTAFGDYDNDGDVDLLVSNCGGPPLLLRNDGGNHNSWLSLRLVGRQSNQNAIGAQVVLTDGALRLERQVAGGGSYASASDYRVHFGLGNRSKAIRVEIRWPSGLVEILEQVQVGRHLVIIEGEAERRFTLKGRSPAEWEPPPGTPLAPRPVGP